MKKHSMVCHEDQDVLGLLDDLFRDDGYTVTSQHVPVSDVHTLRRISPDVLIVEHRLHRREAPTVVDFIRALSVSRDRSTLPVIIITTWVKALADDIDWLLSQNVRVVTAPFTVEILLQAVEQGHCLSS